MSTYVTVPACPNCGALPNYQLSGHWLCPCGFRWPSTTPPIPISLEIDRSAFDTLRQAAAVRARIVAALLAEIGDAATAERLADVVIRALD